MTHPAIRHGAHAVITGGASGIGLAAAKRFARDGLKVSLVDLGADRLKAAGEAVDAAVPGAQVEVYEADVSDPTALARVRDAVGPVHVLMNNAGIGLASDILGPEEAWRRVLGVNLGGVINGIQVFLPAMLAHGEPGLVINTGSKQGITTPPGNPAYNVSKAGVKAFTEALAHDLRNRDSARITAHLLIPGFVFTGMTARGGDKPAAAWTPEQTVDFMISALEKGDFYILCPDNDVPRALDEKRIAWAAGDIIENRPALSRWHPDYAESFAAFVKG